MTAGDACTNNNNGYSQVIAKDWQFSGICTGDGDGDGDGQCHWVDCLNEVDHERGLAYDDQRSSWHRR